MKIKTCLALFCTLLWCSSKAQNFNIEKYGAVGNGTTMNTAAIQKAIDAASANGGGKVVVPKGTFLTGTVRLKSNVDLSLDKGAVLLGSTSLSDYEKNDRWYALILTDKQSNITITGYGTIDGQGKTLALNIKKMVQDGKIDDPLKLNRPDEKFRPQLIEIQNSDKVKIQHVTLKNSSCWVETYNKCTNLEIDSIQVQSTAYWNNDGMDVVDCKNVLIKNCNINAADDGICLKSSDPAFKCENVLVKDCKIRSSASAVKFGTASLGGFKNIKVDHIEVYDTYRCALSLEIVDGGTMEDIDVSNINAKNTGGGIFIRLGRRLQTAKGGIVRRIHISNVRVEIPKGKPDVGYDIAGPPEEDIYPHNLLPLEVVGLPHYLIQDVTLEKIEIIYGGGADKKKAYVSTDSLPRIPEREKEYPEFSMFGELPAWGMYARHAQGLTIKNITFKYLEKDFRPALVFDDIKQLYIDGLNVPTLDTAPLIILRKVNNESIQHVKSPASEKDAIMKLN